MRYQYSTLMINMNFHFVNYQLKHQFGNKVAAVLSLER